MPEGCGECVIRLERSKLAEREPLRDYPSILHQSCQRTLLINRTSSTVQTRCHGVPTSGAKNCSGGSLLQASASECQRENNKNPPSSRAFSSLHTFSVFDFPHSVNVSGTQHSLDSPQHGLNQITWSTQCCGIVRTFKARCEAICPRTILRSIGQARISVLATPKPHAVVVQIVQSNPHPALLSDPDFRMRTGPSQKLLFFVFPNSNCPSLRPTHPARLSSLR